MKRDKKNHFIQTMTSYLVSILILSLFLSSPLWIPFMLSQIKFFLFVSLPNFGAVICMPKCLFLVCNIIIIFLIGESKLSNPSQSPDIYEEYAEYQKRLQSFRNHGEIKTKKENALKEVIGEVNGDVDVKKDDGGATEEKERIDDDDDITEHEMLGGGDEDELEVENVEESLPADELNRKVEEFISRVNMQRRLEARMVTCYG